LLRWRFISAAVIVAVVLALLWLDYAVGPTGAWLTPLLLALAVAAAQELLDMGGARDLRPAAWSVYAAVTMVILAACLPPLLHELQDTGAAARGGLPVVPAAPAAAGFAVLGLPFAALSLGVALVMLGEVLRYRGAEMSLASAALGVLAVAYLGATMSFLAALRYLGGNEQGMAALLTAVLVVKFSDTGQYAFGRLLGRRKLAPRLSPGKTIEGAVGGIVTACAVAWLSLTWLVPLIAPRAALVIPWWQCLIFGVVVALAGMLGDLSMSLVKRDAGRKDSSRWLPGLGGVLDVLDSLLLAAPAAYFWWVLRT
jgi:phosphatidate cytidylyltransferase